MAQPCYLDTTRHLPHITDTLLARPMQRRKRAAPTHSAGTGDRASTARARRRRIRTDSGSESRRPRRDTRRSGRSRAVGSRTRSPLKAEEERWLRLSDGRPEPAASRLTRGAHPAGTTGASRRGVGEAGHAAAAVADRLVDASGVRRAVVQTSLRALVHH